MLLICPGLYWRDAGELTSAAFGLGVAHPTGFPGWCLLGKLASFLPFGSIAFRINLLSAVSGAAVAALTAHLVTTLVTSASREEGVALVARVSGVAAGLCTLLNPTLALHARTAEVYAPTAALLLGALVSVAGGSSRGLRVAAALTGLLAGFHGVSAALPAGVALLVGGWHQGRGGGRMRVALAVFGLGVLGAFVLLYLPTRAAAQPWANWGSPDTLERLWDHLTGARVRAAYAAEMNAGARAFVTVPWALRQLFEQTGWLGPAASLGVLALWRKRRGVGLVLAFVVLADVGYTAFINPMGMRDAQTGLHAALGVVVLAGVGIGWATRGLGRPAFGATATFAGLLTLAVFAEPAARVDGCVGPSDLASLAIEPLSPDTVLLVSSDDVAATATYAQAVENVRPDVLLVVKQHVTDPHTHAALATRDGLGRMSSGVAPTPGEALQQLLKNVRERVPVAWEVGDNTVDFVVGDAGLGWPFIRIAPGAATPDSLIAAAQATRARMRWEALGASGQAVDSESLGFIGRSLSLTGAFALARGKDGLGTSLLAAAAQVAPDDAKVALNIGARLVTLRQSPRAVPFLETAAKLRPDSPLAAFNLGVALAESGDVARGRQAFRTSARLQMSPERAARALEVLAVADANAGRYGRGWLLLRAAEPHLPSVSRPAALETLRRLGETILSESAPGTITDSPGGPRSSP